MATYRELHGKTVKTVTTNPSDDAAEGQIWFNSTDNTFKSSVALQAWHSSGARVTNSIPAGQGGTQNAAWFCGGTLSGSGPGTNTEEYNGSGWSTGGTMSTARRYGQGWGTQTAAITASGSPMSPPNSGMTATEEYNGTAWTAGTAVPSPYVRYNGAGMGAVQTAGAILCGSQNPPDLNTTLEWNGSSWTGGGNYPFSGPLGTGSAGGTLTAGIAMGGPSQGNVVCKYDGSSWTTTTNYPDSKSRIGVAGTQTAAIGFGGQNSSGTTTNAFLFDGSTFTATGSLGVTNSSGSGHYGMGGSSPSTTTVGMFQGDSATEEFNQSAAVITAGAWSAGGNLNTARYQHAGAGSIPAGLVFGGRKETAPSANYNNSEEYNGTSWTEGNNLNTARFGLYGIGTQTAGLACGGRTTPAVVDSSEEYDGTSYTEGNNLASARQAGASAGTQTAGLIFNGTNVTAPAPGNMTTTSQSYDGTSWTATNSCNTARVVPYGFGTQTAAISVGGNPFSTSGESFDGTNWTAISGTLNDGRQQGFSGGTSTDGLVCGGNSPPNTTNVEAYNGTIFTTAPSLSTARRSIAGTPGTSVPAGIFGAGGYTSTELNSTEEFTPESTSLNIETLTQS